MPPRPPHQTGLTLTLTLTLPLTLTLTGLVAIQLVPWLRQNSRLYLTPI